jgi:restriction system protein
MGTVLVVALAAVIAAVVVTGLVRAGRHEAQAEKARLAEEAQRQARRSLDAVRAMDDRQFEEYIAQLFRRDGCTDVKRVGGAGDLLRTGPGRTRSSRPGSIPQCANRSSGGKGGNQETNTH